MSAGGGVPAPGLKGFSSGSTLPSLSDLIVLTGIEDKIGKPALKRRGSGA
jgi:hypothetical protein